MKPSPIQTRSIVYGDFSIEPHGYGEVEPPDEETFDWQGVRFHTIERHGQMEVGGETVYPLFLRVNLPNDGEKAAPYKLSATVMGQFTFVGKAEPKDILDMVVVNGLSILYSALRETVLTLTSRMLNGPMCLPGANFQDSKPSERKANSKKRINPKRSEEK